MDSNLKRVDSEFESLVNSLQAAADVHADGQKRHIESGELQRYFGICMLIYLCTASIVKAIHLLAKAQRGRGY